MTWNYLSIEYLNKNDIKRTLIISIFHKKKSKKKIEINFRKYNRKGIIVFFPSNKVQRPCTENELGEDIGNRINLVLHFF